MIDASTKTARAIAGAGVFTAAACTTVMNASFGYSLGHSPLEQYLLVAFGVSLDVVKFLGLSAAAVAWNKGYKSKSTIAFLVWTVAVIYSLNAALGFATATRSAVNQEREFATQFAETNIAKHKRLVEELETAKANKRYKTTSGCTVPNEKMAPESREFCSEFWSKANDLAKAEQALPKQVALEADPQAKFYAKWTGLSVEAVNAVWAIVLAMFAEIVASFGTYAFSSSRAVPVRMPVKGSRKPVQRDSDEEATQVAVWGKKADGTPKAKPGRKPKLVVNNAA